jgi:glutaconate CoA-transferase subunit A
MAKFQSLKEAVAGNLGDGDVAAFEGFTHLIPVAAAHEAIRQRAKNLTLIRMRTAVRKSATVAAG